MENAEVLSELDQSDAKLVELRKLALDASTVAVQAYLSAKAELDKAEANVRDVESRIRFLQHQLRANAMRGPTPEPPADPA